MFTNEMVYDLHHWDSNDLDQFIGLNMDLEQFITLNSILEVLRQVLNNLKAWTGLNLAQKRNPDFTGANP